MNGPEFSPKEIAKLAKARAQSDAKKISEGAEYAMDKGAKDPRLEFTKEQVENARREMRSSLIGSRAMLLVRRLIALERMEKSGAPDRFLEEFPKRLFREALEKWKEVLPPSEREESRVMERAFREAVVDAAYERTEDRNFVEFLKQLLERIEEGRARFSDEMLNSIREEYESYNQEGFENELNFLRQKLSIPEEEFEQLIRRGEEEANESDALDFTKRLLFMLDKSPEELEQ